MKIYSNDSVTHSDLSTIAAEVAITVSNEVNARQDRQIMQTRVAIGLTFAANLLIALALRFL